MVRRSKKSSTVISLNFDGVEKRQLLPEGDYNFRVDEVTKEQGEKGEYLTWVFQVVDDDQYSNVKVWHNTSLTEQSRWSLMALLENLGVEIPKGQFDLDIEELVDLTVGGTIIHEEWQGKPKPKFYEFFPAGEEAEAEKPAATEAKSKATSAKKGNALEKLKEEDIGEMDEDELTGVVEKYKLDVDLDEYKTLRRKANIIIDKLEAANYLEK